MKEKRGERSERREERREKAVFVFVFFSLFSSLFSPLHAAAEPFFVTIQKVELKTAAGEWVSVLEPDKKVDLAQEEPSLSFFNNGRVVPGEYVNVRVYLDRGMIERIEDYQVPLAIRRGSFVNVSFSFDLTQINTTWASQHVKQVQVTVDEDERLDGSEQLRVEA